MTVRSALTLAGCVAAAVLLPVGSAGAAYAPAATAAIHPGVMTFTEGSQCTANFVFKDAKGGLYLGQAAHCAGLGAATDTDGCKAKSLPLGTKVDIGGSKPGTLVYSSWLAMQAAKEKDAATCAYNDLALVKIDPADAGKVNPSIPFFGGPVVLGTKALSPGDTVLSYGNSGLRAGLSLLSPKQGLVLGGDGGGYSTTVLTLTPGIPGDSGSGFLNGKGEAVGVLSTLSLTPLPGTNGVGNLAREVDYANAHGNLGGKVSLVKGTEPFRGSSIGAAAVSHAKTALGQRG